MNRMNDNFPSLPGMHHVKQNFEVPDPVGLRESIHEQWEHLDDRIKALDGARIAVGVGSRGIDHIAEIVKQVVDLLKSAGALPFIVPAMGSHGGAEARGQKQVLAHLGITPRSMGVDIVADMAVVSMGEADGIPLVLSRPAFEADGLVLINRVKPHTDFTGPVESGIHKMMVIGLGNREGADFYHRLAIRRGFCNMILTAGRALIEKTNFLFGVAVVENQHHQICRLEIADRTRLEKTEEELMLTARACLPKLPLNEIDLLIVDQMGKDFSGAGLDPNVVGFSSCRWGIQMTEPNISRVFVRKLSKASRGNGSGIGMVDFATSELVDAIDWEVTAVNARTACCPEDCKVPMTLENEKEVIATALTTIRPYTLEDLRIVHIKNTLELDSLYLSRGCLAKVKPELCLTVDPTPLEMAFDPQGRIAYRPEAQRQEI